MDNIYNIVSDMDVPVGMTKRTLLVRTVGSDIHITNNMGSLVWNCYPRILQCQRWYTCSYECDDIRAGFAGAEEFAQDTTNSHPMW